MSSIYDNWERLVAAVIRREQLWQMFHDQSRSPSNSSISSTSSSNLILSSPHDEQRSLPAAEKSQKIEESVARLAPGMVFFEDSFEIENLLRSSVEFLGRGTFGSAYAAVSGNGMKIVLKRFEVLNIREKRFRQQLKIIGNVRHENVAALRGYCFSKDEQLLLYDHYGNGSLSSMLHGKPGENRAHLDWETRLRIAVGASKGIAHIHKQSNGKLVHGNIKASNIFVNRQQYGCVSDLGLASTIAVPVKRTSGYHAPEIRNTRNVTQASDVYSFGILLLELVTRKCPTGEQGVDLVKLVNSINEEQTAEVLDIELLRSPFIERDIVKMLRIGMTCTAQTPKKRPKMAEVAKMIEEDRINNTGHYLNYNLVLVEGLKPAFNLKDLLKSSSDILGRGTIRTSYKVVLDNGSAFVVKRLNKAFTDKEFEQLIGIIRKTRHENVAELRAYYWSSDEKFTVYDYHSQGSVSEMLHGKCGENQISLDWETRLRIAVGAARGISHIHTQFGHSLEHGNIKASNIFLNGQGYGCISDFGLSTLSKVEYKKVSQASDVYSFGVVLLELLSGQPYVRRMKNGEVVHLVRWVDSVIRTEWSDKVFDAELQRCPNTEEEMVRLLQIAMFCVARDPQHRPKMHEVVNMLDDIRGMTSLGSQPLNEALIKVALPIFIPSMAIAELGLSLVLN